MNTYITDISILTFVFIFRVAVMTFIFGAAVISRFVLFYVFLFVSLVKAIIFPQCL